MKNKSKKTVQVPVIFTYSDPLANAVFVAGSFNDWSHTASALTQDAPGRWLIKMPLSPGRHEYLFVVDGVWVADPHARESCPNPHGGVNAVIQI